MKFVLKSRSEEDSEQDDDIKKEKIESDIYRDNNHIYFYIEIDRSSILHLFSFKTPILHEIFIDSFSLVAFKIFCLYHHINKSLCVY
jgi:c-di-AMP phosphodiesterase-like protein